MKNLFIPVLVFFLGLTLWALAVPETLELVDGRKLEKVTSAVMEDSKVKVNHSGGVGRIAPDKFTADSLKALGLAGGENDPAPVPEITRLETTKGEVYEQIRSLRVRPSFISFVHKDGSATVRFDVMPEKLREAFHYDPQLAAAFDSEENARLDAEAKKEQEAEQAIEEAKAKVEARQMAREMAFRDAVVKRIERSMDLRRTYGSDLGGYIQRNESMWQREADLHAAARARALQGR